MSDKNLTELEWKKFSKGKGFKDAPFVKALAALETAKDAQARLAALDAIDKECDALRKANKADKELAHYLDDADKAALKERKAAEFEAKKAAASSSDDEEDSPALLTTKLVPLLRGVPKGEVLHSLVALGSKECAVLVSRKPIGPPRRKLLTDYLGVTSGVKFIAGECIWEANAHTFVVQNEVGGLAKKLKAALQKQTELRYKVRVRGEDGTVDDDGEPGEGGEAHEGQEAEAHEVSPEEAQHKQLTATLAKMMPLVQQAITAHPDRRAEIMALLTAFQGQMKAQQFDAAKATLLDVGKALQALKAGAAPGKTSRAPSRPLTPIWEQAGENAIEQVTGLIVELRGLNDPELDRMADDLLESVSAHLEDLADVLTEYDELEGAERESMAAEALDVLKQYRQEIAGDGLIKAADHNPLGVKIELIKTLERAIDEIESAFQA